MQINENRDLYDLCRKYKFFYKQHEEIKKLDTCYWNKHIREAYKKSERDLNNVTKEIIKLILNDFIYEGGVSINVNAPTEFDAFRRCGKSIMSSYRPMEEVTFTSNGLAIIVKEMMMEKGYGY